MLILPKRAGKQGERDSGEERERERGAGASQENAARPPSGYTFNSGGRANNKTSEAPTDWRARPT